MNNLFYYYTNNRNSFDIDNYNILTVLPKVLSFNNSTHNDIFNILNCYSSFNIKPKIDYIYSNNIIPLKYMLEKRSKEIIDKFLNSKKENIGILYCGNIPSIIVLLYISNYINKDKITLFVSHKIDKQYIPDIYNSIKKIYIDDTILSDIELDKYLIISTEFNPQPCLKIPNILNKNDMYKYWKDTFKKLYTIKKFDDLCDEHINIIDNWLNKLPFVEIEFINEWYKVQYIFYICCTMQLIRYTEPLRFSINNNIYQNIIIYFDTVYFLDYMFKTYKNHLIKPIFEKENKIFFRKEFKDIIYEINKNENVYDCKPINIENHLMYKYKYWKDNINFIIIDTNNKINKIYYAFNDEIDKNKFKTKIKLDKLYINTFRK